MGSAGFSVVTYIGVVCKNAYVAVEHIGNIAVVGFVYYKNREIVGDICARFRIKGRELALVCLEYIGVLACHPIISVGCVCFSQYSVDDDLVCTVACNEQRRICGGIKLFFWIYRCVGEYSDIAYIVIGIYCRHFFVCGIFICACTRVIAEY